MKPISCLLPAAILLCAWPLTTDAAPASQPDLAVAIDSVLAGRTPLDQVRIHAANRRGEGRADIYGRGVAFFNGVQIKLTPEQVRRMLDSVRTAKFTTMDVQTIGGSLATASLQLRVGPVWKSLAILGHSRPLNESEASLSRLVDDILAPCVPLAKESKTTTDRPLPEVLEMVISGDLAPEAMSVAFNETLPGGIVPSISCAHGQVSVRSREGTTTQADTLIPRLAKAVADAKPQTWLSYPTGRFFAQNKVFLRIAIGRLTIIAEADNTDEAVRSAAADPAAQKQFEQRLATLRKLQADAAKP